MEWFSLDGIRQEIKKIRWPRRNEMTKDTYIVIAFILIFALYFILSDFIVSLLLRLLGVIV